MNTNAGRIDSQGNPYYKANDIIRIPIPGNTFPGTIRSSPEEAYYRQAASHGFSDNRKWVRESPSPFVGHYRYYWKVDGQKRVFGGSRKIRKHSGIHQTGGKAGKLKKGYKYSGKKLKNGKAEIKKSKK